MPNHRDSFALQTLLKNIVHTFMDFAQQVMSMGNRDDLDNQEFRSAMVTLRLEFLTKI